MASGRCHSDVQYIAMASSGCHKVKSLVAIKQLSSTFSTEVWGVASYVAVVSGSWCISSTSVGTKRLTMACVQQNWLKIWEKLDKARKTNKATNNARLREPFPSLTWSVCYGSVYRTELSEKVSKYWELLNDDSRRFQLENIKTHCKSGGDVFNSMFNAYHCSSSVLNLTHDFRRRRIPLRLLIRPWIFKKCYGSNVRCHSDILC